MIYLHIGRHKTGTTAIQRFLHINRDRLAERGYVYPLPLSSPWAHHGIVYALDRRKRRHDLSANAGASLSALRREMAGASQIVVSSEGFQNLDPQSLIGIFKPGETLIVVYLREQLEYLLSAYAQRIQAQLVAESFEAYAQRVRLDYGAFLDTWSAVYGLDAMRVGVFDRDHLTRGSIVEDFLHKIGLQDLAGLESPGTDPNTSLSYLLILLKRLLNRSLTEDQHSGWKLYTTFSRLTSIDSSRQQRIPVTDADAAQIRARYVKSNLYVKEKYFSNEAELFHYRSFQSCDPFTEFDVRNIVSKLQWLAPDVFKVLHECVSDQRSLDRLPEDERLLANSIRPLVQ